MSNEELWQAVLAQIQLNISQANFATWFKSTRILSNKNGQIIVSVPNAFAKEWLEQKYNKLVFRILHTLSEEIKDITYRIGKTEAGILKKNPFQPEDPAGQLEFQEFTINKETNLNPRYLFENFVVGPFNELPQAAAVAVSKNPGFVYNPLFIYGGVGLGKTHLLQAIGNEIIKNFPSKKVKYIPSEKFTAGVVASIKNHQMDDFKSRYRTIDVLIIDDVQFLAGKEKTQEEFFHTFNTLYEKNKQIIISSDRPPKSIPALAERLRSRFEGGMIADVSFPDFETRLAILKTKIQEKKIKILDDVLNYIAENIKRNIRELEGALNILIAHQKMQNQPLGLESIKPLFKTLVSDSNKIVTPQKIIQTVSEFYDLKEREIISPSRRKEIVRPRQIAMYFLRKELKGSFPFIGRKFGGKDHTTAIYAFEKIAKEIENNKNFEDEIEMIRQRVYSS